MAIELFGKIGTDIKYAAAATIVVWLIFYYLFPTQPLSVSDTLVVLVILLILTKSGRALYVRWRRPHQERRE